MTKDEAIQILRENADKAKLASLEASKKGDITLSNGYAWEEIGLRYAVEIVKAITCMATRREY